MELSIVPHLNDETDLESDLSAMEKCMETLKDEQKQTVELFYLQQKSYREVEQLTNFDLKAVKSHIQNGKRNLKNCMEQNK